MARLAQRRVGDVNMSNIFRSQGVPFFPVPQDLIRSGKFAKLSGAAVKLYDLICYEAQRTSSAAVLLSNRTIEELAGLSPSAIRRARTQLWELGLLDAAEDAGKPTLYVVLNPQTRQPTDNLPEKYQARYKKLNERSARILQRQRVSEAVISPPSWRDMKG